MIRKPSLPSLAWQIADLIAQGAEELRSAADPVPVADRLLVAAQAACRDLRAAATRDRVKEQDRRRAS